MSSDRIRAPSAAAIEKAIQRGEQRAGFESERAHAWGWFSRIDRTTGSYWEWSEACSAAEELLMQLLFAELHIFGEPRPTRDGYCILAKQ